MVVWCCLGCGSHRRTSPIGWPRFEPRNGRDNALVGICGRCADLRPKIVRDWDESEALHRRTTAAGLGGGDPEADR